MKWEFYVLLAKKMKDSTYDLYHSINENMP